MVGEIMVWIMLQDEIADIIDHIIGNNNIGQGIKLWHTIWWSGKNQVVGCFASSYVFKYIHRKNLVIRNAECLGGLFDEV